MFRCHNALYTDGFVCLDKLIKFFFLICLLPDFHSGENKDFQSSCSIAMQRLAVSSFSTYCQCYVVAKFYGKREIARTVYIVTRLVDSFVVAGVNDRI